MFSGPAFLWASVERTDNFNYSNLKEINYTNEELNAEGEFIAESHLTRTSHISEGQFTEKNIFQTKILNTPTLNDETNFSNILKKYE
jgi:hypothetical protein